MARKFEKYWAKNPRNQQAPEGSPVMAPYVENEYIFFGKNEWYNFVARARRMGRGPVSSEQRPMSGTPLDLAPLR
jgi:hypothetical protein